MPYPGVPKNKTAKMERCIEHVKAKNPGWSKSRAIATCNISVTGKQKKGKSK